MASSTELGNCAAQALGLPATALASHVRLLREAGQLSKAGRGITGAKMSSLDGAKLLIAAASSINIKDGVPNLSTYGALRTNKAWLLETMPLPELVRLPPDHTLLEALSAFIESAVNGSLRNGVDAIEAGRGDDIATMVGPPMSITVSLLGPVRRARIQFLNFWIDGDGKVWDDYDDACDYHISGEGKLPRIDVQQVNTDLAYQFSFTHRTIQQVADLLAG